MGIHLEPTASCFKKEQTPRLFIEKFFSQRILHAKVFIAERLEEGFRNNRKPIIFSTACGAYD